MPHTRHDWTVALVAFIASLVVNGLIFAYGYGKLEQRVRTLEAQREEMRAEWKEARTRIEAALKEKR